jgi:ribosomal RNA assembly protein
MKYVRVPDDRLEVLKKDNKIAHIEEQTGSSIHIDQDCKTVSINNTDSVNEMDTKKTINAISVGFSVTESMKLSHNELYQLEIINLKNATRNKSEMKRQKGRIIGKDGRTKEIIGDLSDVSLSIYKNKIGIIGDSQDVLKSRDVILDLINGRPHSSVYNELESYQKQKNSELPDNFVNY